MTVWMNEVCEPGWPWTSREAQQPVTNKNLNPTLSQGNMPACAYIAPECVAIQPFELDSCSRGRLVVHLVSKHAAVPCRTLHLLCSALQAPHSCDQGIW